MGSPPLQRPDYIEREGRYEKDREELEHSESDRMPEWAKDDPRSYWEAADEHERANGSLFREITFALPKELNEEQRRELASGFAADVTEGERLPYTLAIHRGGPDGGESPCAPDDLGAGQRRDREQPGAVVPALQREGPGEGGSEKEPNHDVAGVGKRYPRGVGAGGQ